MGIINIEIRCDVKQDVVDSMLSNLCSNHLIAGATHMELKTCEWVGGQLTNKTIIIINGISKSELVNEVTKLLPSGCLVTSIIENKICDSQFEEWFNMHL